MDKYDVAIAYLTENPQDIRKAWYYPGDETTPEVAQAHCLFQAVSRGGKAYSEEHIGEQCGCLTQIRSDFMGGKCAKTAYYGAPTERLWNSIAHDDRIPPNTMNLHPDRLSVFAQWQRKLDRTIRS